MGLPTVTKIGIGWVIIAVSGIYSFVYSKRHVDEKRYRNMKARERIRNATMVD